MHDRGVTLCVEVKDQCIVLLLNLLLYIVAFAACPQVLLLLQHV